MSSPHTILIIDDDALFLDLMRRWLSDAGYAVREAKSGDAGLTAAREQRPSLILLDVFMPGKHGFAVLDELKRDAATAGIPVILTTNYSKDTAGFSEGQGAADFILKAEATPREIADRIGRILGSAPPVSVERPSKK